MIKVFIKDSICKEKKMDLENMFGQMEVIILENGIITKCREKENFTGLMVDNIREIGKIV
jgi:hypothetical protein